MKWVKKTEARDAFGRYIDLPGFIDGEGAYWGVSFPKRTNLLIAWSEILKKEDYGFFLKLCTGEVEFVSCKETPTLNYSNISHWCLVDLPDYMEDKDDENAWVKRTFHRDELGRYVDLPDFNHYQEDDGNGGGGLEYTDMVIVWSDKYKKLSYGVFYRYCNGDVFFCLKESLFYNSPGSSGLFCSDISHWYLKEPPINIIDNNNNKSK